MSKRGFKHLPPSTFLLYDKIQEFIKEYNNTENINEKDYNIKRLHYKIVWLLQVMSYELFHMPIFSDQFTAMHDGPVPDNVYKIYQNGKAVPKSSKKVDKDMLSYYQMIGNFLLDILKDAVKNNKINISPEYLSTLSHTSFWDKRYKDWEKYKGTSQQFNHGKFTQQEMNQYTELLKEKHPEFIEYINKEMDNKLINGIADDSTN